MTTELMTKATVLEYMVSIREAMESGNTTLAGLLVGLLEDIATPDTTEHKCSVRDCTWCNEDDDIFDDGDILDSDIVNDHCDYCGDDGIEVFGVMDSDFNACAPCMANHFNLISSNASERRWNTTNV